MAQEGELPGGYCAGRTPPPMTQTSASNRLIAISHAPNQSGRCAKSRTYASRQ
jgi:hypothetical protein